MGMRVQEYFLMSLFFLITIVKSSDVKGGFVLLAKGHLLKRSLIRETTTESLMECIQQCLIEGPNCKSINYGVSSLVKGKCQLNNKYAIGSNGINLVADKDFVHYERDTGGAASCLPPLSCAQLYKDGERKDGVYTIDPDNRGAFHVRCDMSTTPGGWTVFQRRVDGSEDFYRGWADYKTGFGNLNGEFWLGLDKIRRLSKAGQNILRVDLEDFDNATRYAEYGTFAIASETYKYKLTVGDYSGDAGDSLTHHNGMRFTAKDDDNDKRSDGNCAKLFKGAWWYNSCHVSNLNGLYLGGPNTKYGQGVEWYHWKRHYYSLKKTELRVRPRHF